MNILVDYRTTIENGGSMETITLVSLCNIWVNKFNKERDDAKLCDAILSYFI